jgi:hypothetical protein
MYQVKLLPSKAIQAGCIMQRWLMPGTALSQLPAHPGQLHGILAACWESFAESMPVSLPFVHLKGHLLQPQDLQKADQWAQVPRGPTTLS